MKKPLSKSDKQYSVPAGRPPGRQAASGESMSHWDKLPGDFTSPTDSLISTRHLRQAADNFCEKTESVHGPALKAGLALRALRRHLAPK
jgi:hypothetical protein